MFLLIASTIGVNVGYWGVLESRNNNKVLDVSDAKNVVGAAVQVYSANGTDAQKWRLTSDGYFQAGLRSVDGYLLVLEVVNGFCLQLNTKNDSLAQK